MPPVSNLDHRNFPAVWVPTNLTLSPSILTSHTLVTAIIRQLLAAPVRFSTFPTATATVAVPHPHTWRRVRRLAPPLSLLCDQHCDRRLSSLPVPRMPSADYRIPLPTGFVFHLDRVPTPPSVQAPWHRRHRPQCWPGVLPIAREVRQWPVLPLVPAPPQQRRQVGRSPKQCNSMATATTLQTPKSRSVRCAAHP